LPARTTPVKGTATLTQPLVLDGLLPDRIPPRQSIRIVASLPNGSIQPLVWLHEYDERYRHPFLFRKAITLPAGTVIRGVPNDALVELIQH